MMVVIVRLYDDHTEAADAVTELRKAGVPERDISIITRDDRASAAATGAEIGAAVGGLTGLLTGLGLIAIPGIGPVVATGWLAATAAGAAMTAHASCSRLVTQRPQRGGVACAELGEDPLVEHACDECDEQEDQS